MRVSALNRKLLRELRQHWSQVLSIAAVVGCGVMAVLAMRSTMGSVERARDAYYEDYRFAHVFSRLERAPDALAHRLAAIPGVAAVQARVVEHVTLDVPGLDEPALADVVSIPAERAPMPNDLYLRRGRWIASGRASEVIASDRFAELNHLQPGDSIGAVLNGRWQRLRVVGVASSPEYVYEIGAQTFMVDNRKFGILWMGRDALAAAAGLDGAFNDVALRLAPGASAPAVIAAVDTLLRPYGGTGAHDRGDQASNRVVGDEMTQLRSMATLFPIFFLATSAFLLNVVLSRLVDTQREELAALKAFGYPNPSVALHYLGFAAASIAVGSVLGIGGGMWLGYQETTLYAEFFRFPRLRHETQWSTAAAAIGICGSAALLGSIGAIRRAVRLPPAEALRPPSPAHFHPLLAERLGIAGLLSPAARMILRNLERRPLRTLTSIVGVGLAGALLIAGRYPYNGMDMMMDLAFRQSQREDHTVAFTGPRNGRAAAELRALPGVVRVEPFRSVAVRLRHRQHARTVAITGMDAAGGMRRLVDSDGGVHAVPPVGAVLSSGLARALDVGVGDTLVADVFERGGRARPLPVVAVLPEAMGANAYMDRRALNRFVGEGDVVSGAVMRVDAARWPAVRDRIGKMPGAVGTTSRQAMIDYVNESMARNIAITTVIIIVAAAAIALAVVYNAARIALSERGRELASLRVLGFTRREVSGLLLGEQGVLTTTGIVLGFAFGWGFAALIARGFQAERHSFPLVIFPSTYLFSAGIVAVTAVVASLIVRRRVDHLDLVAVLKTRE